MRGRAEAGPAEEPRRQARRGAGPASMLPAAGGEAAREASRAARRRGFGSLRGAEPLGRGLARHGGGAGLAAEVAQPPPLPRPSLKKGCASRHFSSLKIQLSPSFARLAFALGLAHAGLPGSAGHRHRGGFALPRAAARGLSREGGRPHGVGGRRLRAPVGVRHSAMLAGAVFLRRVSRPPSRCLSVPGLPPPRGLGSARAGSAALGHRRRLIPSRAPSPFLKGQRWPTRGWGGLGPARAPRGLCDRPCAGRGPDAALVRRGARGHDPGPELSSGTRRGGGRPGLAHAGGCGLQVGNLWRWPA